MKTHFLAMLILLVIINRVSAQSELDGYKTSFNYNVPESPAFSILDLNPSKVMRGTDAKALAVNIVNQIASQQKISSGIALDVCPLQAFSSLNNAFLGKNPGYFYRLLNYTQISFATADATDGSDLLYGLGARITLYDSKDLLRPEYRNRISKALEPKGFSRDPNISADDTSDNPAPNTNNNLSNEMQKIRKEFESSAGFSITTGYANAGFINEGKITFQENNIIINGHQAWLAMQFQAANGMGLNFIYIGKYGPSIKPGNSIGLALRLDNKKFNYSIEFINDFTKRISSVGGIIEIKALQNIDILFNVSGTNEHNDDPNNKKFYLNVKPTIRYVLAG